MTSLENLSRCNVSCGRSLISHYFEKMPARKVAIKKKVAPIRGTRIQFVKGSYVGEKGWLNKAMESTTSFAHVILDGGQSPRDDADYVTRVKLTSITMYSGKVTSPEEYIVQEDPKVAKHLAELAVAVAETGFHEATPDLLVLFKCFIDEAIAQHAAKGKKAKYSACAMTVAQMFQQKKRVAAAMEEEKTD